MDLVEGLWRALNSEVPLLSLTTLSSAPDAAVGARLARKEVDLGGDGAHARWLGLDASRCISVAPPSSRIRTTILDAVESACVVDDFVSVEKMD